MVILFSQARGLPVVTAGEAAELGTVDALTIDASTQSISHIRLSGTRAKSHAVLAWDLVRTVGQDAVIAHFAPPPKRPPPRLRSTGRPWAAAC
ncbi:PRC-barrel domain-containing protein [Streptomyces syringium]|uniref:PRC-barrel domain-containing protein n=1 Tax=Streptomyces syringium TaxID=76729 RepID=UPI003D8FE2B2